MSLPGSNALFAYDDVSYITDIALTLSTDTGPFRIDIDYLGGSSLIRQNDVNLDFHFHAKWGLSPNERRPMSVNDNRLTVTFK